MYTMFALFNRPQNIRIVFAMLLIFFAGSKIITPVYKMAKAVYKEVADLNSAEENSTGQMAEKEAASDKPYYQNSLYAAFTIYDLNYTIVSHATDHTDNYLAGHLREITSPPPDTIL